MLLLNQGRAHFSVKNRRINIVIFKDHKQSPLHILLLHFLKQHFENVKGLSTHKQQLDLVPGLVC